MIHDFETFPVLIRKIENLIDDDYINNIISSLSKFDYTPHSTFVGEALSTYEVPTNNFILDNFDDLKQKIINQVDNYSQVIGMDSSKLILLNSWINLQSKGSRLLFHIHPRSIISGVLFLKIDNDSSHLAFKNPNPFSLYANYFNNFKESNKYNHQYCMLKPNVADLVLFPSWLEHGSHIETNSEERIVLSFNLDYRY